MSWRSLLAFTFENHAALDETGHGFHGRVELPAADRWRDAPAQGIATAIAYDHPESKIVVPPRSAFADWRGVRVRVRFRAAAASGRLDLVEGDGSFALFVEPGGVLRGTINDGSPAWWGVSSAPGKVAIDRWHLAELLYDAGQVLALSLDGELLGVRTTAGLPIRPVGPAGIRIGYWPGGDPRYTFRGLMGPVWIDTLDEREPLVGLVNSLLCSGSNGTSRLETWKAILEQELTPFERSTVRTFGGMVVEAMKRLVTVVVGQASDPARTLDELTALADELGRLALAHETAGTDLLADPALGALVQRLYDAACRENPAARSVFVLEGLRFITALPLGMERWKALLDRRPELCRTGVPPVELGTGPGDDALGWLGCLAARLRSEGARGADGSGSSGSEGASADPCGPRGGLLATELHIHVHSSCSRSGGAQ